MDIKPITNEHEYAAALERIDELFDSAMDSTEGDEIDAICKMIEEYERVHYPIDPPSPEAALKFRADQELVQ